MATETKFLRACNLKNPSSQATQASKVNTIHVFTEFLPTKFEKGMLGKVSTHYLVVSNCIFPKIFK